MSKFIFLATFGTLALFLCTLTSADDEISCTSQGQCGNGICEIGKPWNETAKYNLCKCDEGYIHSEDGKPCEYAQKSKLTAFLISFFLGAVGGDWFYLSQGTAGYIIAGLFKLITLGGLGIWYFVDWVRILCDSFYDGNGIQLAGW